MDEAAVRNKTPARSHPDRVRNALLAAMVFELAVVALGLTDVSGDLGVAFVVGLALTVCLGVFGLGAFLYYLVTV